VRQQKWHVRPRRLSLPPTLPFGPSVFLLSASRRAAKNGSLGANCYFPASKRERGEGERETVERDDEGRGADGQRSEIKEKRKTPPATRANDK